MMREYTEDESDETQLTNSIKNNFKHSKLRRHSCVIILWVYSLLAYCDRYALSGILSELKIVFNIGNTGVAFLQTVFVVSYMLFAPIVGYYGDRYDRKKMILAGLALQIASNIAGYFIEDNFNLLLCIRILLGIAECVNNVLIFPFISDLFPPQQRTYAIQCIVTAVPIGSGLGYILGSWASLHFGGWQHVLLVTTPIAVPLFITMIFVLPGNLERGGMEPEISKTAFGFKEDLKFILKVRSFLSVLVGCICSQMVTGAATVFFPDFVSSAGILQGVVVPCSQPPCEYAHIIFRFGALSIFAGFTGAILAIGLSKLGHDYFRNQLIEAELCAIGCLVAGFSVFMVVAFSNVSLTFGWIFSSFVLIGLSINWGLSAELVISVIPPNRRSTAKAFFHLISHALGDAPAPLIVGGLSDVIKKYEYDGIDTYLFDFKSMQKSFLITAVPVCIIGGISFFDGALHLLADRKAMMTAKRPKLNSIRENPIDEGVNMSVLKLGVTVERM